MCGLRTMRDAKRPLLTRLANAAFRGVAANVIQQAKQSGVPITLWEDGQVKAVPAEEVDTRLQRRSRKKPRSRKRPSTQPAGSVHGPDRNKQ